MAQRTQYRSRSRDDARPSENGRASENGSKGKKPIFSLVAPTYGGRLEVACWDKEINANGRDVTVFNLAISRSYKDGDKWDKTTSMRSGDLLPLAFLLQRAYDEILSRQADEKDSGRGEGDVPY